MTGNSYTQPELRKRAPHVDTAHMLRIGRAATDLKSIDSEWWTVPALCRVLDVPVTSGVTARDRLREALRVFGYWHIPGGAHLLTEAARQAELSHDSPTGPPMPAWATLTEPTHWKDVPARLVFAWVDGALHANERGLWPAVNEMRAVFGKAPANPRPSSVPGHPSLLDG